MSAPDSPKVLHVIGGSFAQLPTIRRAQQMGYKVLATDRSHGSAAEGVADFFEVADVKDCEATLAAANKHQVDGVVCDTFCLGVPTMAYVAQKRSLFGPSLDCAWNFSNKFRMRSLTESKRVHSKRVRFALCNTIEEAKAFAYDIGDEIMLKPVHGQGSRGVTKVRLRVESNHKELASFEHAFNIASLHCHVEKDQVLAEEVLPGQEISVDSVVLHGKVTILSVSDKSSYSHNPNLAHALWFPSNLGEASLRSVQEVNERVIAALGLENGITHGEFFVHRQQCTVIEIGLRGSGAFVHSHVNHRLTGFDPLGFYIRMVMEGPDALGEVSLPCHSEPNTRRAAVVGFLPFFPESLGELQDVIGLEEARAVAPDNSLIHPSWVVGRCPSAQERYVNRNGIIIAFGDTLPAAIALLQVLYSKLKFVFGDGEQRSITFDLQPEVEDQTPEERPS